MSIFSAIIEAVTGHIQDPSDYEYESDNDDIYESDEPQTRVQSALSVQAACSDDVDYSSVDFDNRPKPWWTDWL